jgi:hypothetical protein
MKVAQCSKKVIWIANLITSLRLVALTPSQRAIKLRWTKRKSHSNLYLTRIVKVRKAASSEYLLSFYHPKIVVLKPLSLALLLSFLQIKDQPSAPRKTQKITTTN